MQPNELLLKGANQLGTPLYLYDLDLLIHRYRELDDTFERRFRISYAVKANPNSVILETLARQGAAFDASSGAEILHASNAGANTADITFTGPGKRREELMFALDQDIGEVVLESLQQAEVCNELALAMGKVRNVMLRINPLRAPHALGTRMSGTASQFGIDQAVLPEILSAFGGFTGLRLSGFHVYSGTNILDAGAVVENFAIFMEIFREAAGLCGAPPDKLVFGAGFGVPYHQGQTQLDLQEVASRVLPMIDSLRHEPDFNKTQLLLELGRWLVAPTGWLLTTVVEVKHSRGTDIVICDAGFNNHLAACGMMGSVVRRNWPINNMSNPEGNPKSYMLVGPLCTSIDMLSRKIDLPEVRTGDILAIAMSGAYGLTASPTRFISHPEPKEAVIRNREVTALPETAQSHESHRHRYSP
jgi:diaminopimelate decarboxylase